MVEIKSNPKIHPFEYGGAHFLYTEERALLADDMGMFKTAQSIYANSKFRQRQPNLRTLIISPTSVREHWARELEQWAYPRGDINLVYTSNLAKGIRDAKKATWTIMAFPTMSRLDEDAIQKLRRTGFHHVIIDEVHNAKNPDAIRTRSIKGLADRADFVSSLSGTPIPNTMSDLYVLMSLMDPDAYPFDPDKSATDKEGFRVARQSFIQLYVDRPQIVKELFHRKMLRRQASDYLSEQIPELRMHRHEVPLTGAHLETYQATVEQDMHVGKKIMDLAKASLDPCLVNPDLPDTRRGGRDISDKYAYLDDVVEREMRKKGGKVLVFTGLKTGVVDYLVDAYQDHGAIAITGDTSTENGTRERLRLQFQRNPNTRVMVTTTSMNEGVDLTAATAVVNLTVPWTPAEFFQRYKRSQRPGEVIKDVVDVYTPFVTIPGPQPSLDVASLGMLDGKIDIVSYLTRGIQVSLEQLRTYDETTKVPRIVRSITSPNRAVFQYFFTWRGLGSERADRRMQRSPEMSKYIAELYPNFSMARNAADIYVPVIRDIEKRRKLETKVDIACGTGMLGYFLDEPTIGIDINPDMIAVGEKLYPKNTLHIGRMDDLPLEDRIADLTLCSLAFQMTEPKYDRPKALLEMNRVLKRGGYSIITIPGSYMTKHDVHRFEDVAGGYGFEIKDHQRNLGPSKMDLYVMRKTSAPKKGGIRSLKWKGDPGR